MCTQSCPGAFGWAGGMEGAGIWLLVTPALCSWDIRGRREDFAAWLCWHSGDVRPRLGTRRNVCFQASFSTLIKTTQARLASPAEPKNCNLVPRGEKASKAWHWTGVKRRPEELVALAEPEGTAAGWHQPGTGPAALPCPQHRAPARLLFDLERRAMTSRSTMFPLRWNPGGKCQLGARGAAQAAGALSGSRLPSPSLRRPTAEPRLQHSFDLADVKLKGSIFWLFRRRKIVIMPKIGILEVAACC